MSTYSAKFNINDYVWVRLNAHGEAILEDQKYTIHDHIRKCGEVRFQLWELMHVFGPHMGTGIPVPFHTNIRIENLVNIYEDKP